MDIETLRPIYGNHRELLDAQRERYDHARDVFAAHFCCQPESVFRTPGRVNLIGEHTDYNGGFVLPVALDKDIVCWSRPRSDKRVQAVNTEPGFAPFSFELAPEIPSAPRGDWSNYFRGAAQEICRRFGERLPLRGLDVCVSGAPPFGVPRGAGLSSSTALAVTGALSLIARNDVAIGRAELAHLCSEAEWYVGTRGGMMDQFSALLGQLDHTLFLDCRPAPDGSYTVEHVPLPAGVQIVLLNSGVRHENVRSDFNQRVAECKIAVRLLQQIDPAIGQLRDVSPAALNLEEADFWPMLRTHIPEHASASQLIDRGLPESWIAHLIADHNLAPDGEFTILPRCRHVIGENRRVLAGVTALRAGQVEAFGALMNEAHISMSEDYQASCPEVDTLAAAARRQPEVLGARITGAGWGGGVVVLSRETERADWVERVRSEYVDRTGLNLDVSVCRPGGGAGPVWP